MAGRREWTQIVSDNLVREALQLWRSSPPKTVALAGGKTPRRFYEALAGEPSAESAAYYFTDERCVPPDDDDSNFKMAFDSLLSKIDAAYYPMPGRTCAADEYERLISGICFDLVILGLGRDGHTASLFPGSPALDETERLCVGVDRPDHARITVTFPVINAAKMALFLVAGAEKSEALACLTAGDASIPASRVAAERVVVIADRAAAGEA